MSSDPPPDTMEVRAFADSRFGWEAVGRLRTAFVQSRNPMLIADDQRRWVTGNEAACGFLGLELSDVPWHRMDDLTPPSEGRRLDEQWAGFLQTGEAEGLYEIYSARQNAVPVEFSATANVLPSRHLVVFMLADRGVDAEADWKPIAGRAANPQLSEREREVMTLVASGQHSDDIAEQLFLSPSTVNSHVNNSMAKLGVHTRAHAVAVSLVTGQISWELHGSDPSTSRPGDDRRPD